MPYRELAARRRRRISRLIFISDVIAVATSVALSIVMARNLEGLTHLVFIGRGSISVTLFMFVAWITGLSIVDSRDAQLLFAGTTYYERTLRGTFYAFSALAVVGFAFDVDAARPFVLVGLPLGLVVVTLSRWLIRQFTLRQVRRTSNNWLTENVLVVQGEGDLDAFEVVAPAPHMRLSDVTTTSDLDQIVWQAIETRSTTVLLRHSVRLTPEQSNLLSWMLNEERINMLVEPTMGSLVRPGRTLTIPHPNVTLLSVKTIHLRLHERVLKRSMDLVLGSVLLIVASPVLILSVVAVACTGRPVFYSQERVGLHGQVFRIWKLRTMVKGAELLDRETREKPPGFTKSPQDPRVTRVGRILRRWSIDELPQLVNVLKGDMSLVGPRPRLSFEIEAGPMSTRRLKARPGMTGAWQTSGRAHTSFEQAEVLDVEYVDNWSVLGDLSILLRTIRAVVSGEGAF